MCDTPHAIEPNSDKFTLQIQEEIFYQICVILSIGQVKILMKLFYSVRPSQPIDCILIVEYYRASEFKFASHVYELHKKISDKITQNNTNYKLRAGVKNRLKAFNVDDVKKLHTYSADPFQILNKLNNNAYVIDFDISSMLNVKDLVDYKGLILSYWLMTLLLSLFFSHFLPLLQDILPNTTDKLINLE